ncbi:hypothetical protein H0G86_006798 [Trichoderma simmonsii]|uniref:NACHT domain-containing protein n=1 Tax=Trichoderma simmonsii TaxID=1491479 RepID=A0A8G0PK99_9HYPO|nr:hypothetical protein H0G86_006798 [Trichoderma simmonsii]
MNSIEPSSRNIANNSFGDNITIHQGNIQNPVAGQTDQCLKDLRLTDPRDDKTRIQQTKGGLLKESSNWIFENETFEEWRDGEQNTLLWIKGDPGKGKTMLLCAIIDELTPRTKLATPMDRTTETFLSYFFCQGTDSRINNATAVLRGLIYLIIIQEHSLISHVQERYKHAGKDLFIDIIAWVALSGMLLNILRDPKIGDIVFVVDALDECETDSAKLLDFITNYASLPRVKWIISSRNNLNIQQKFETFIRNGILSLELKANAETVSNAVDIYIEHRISQLRSIQHNQSQRDALRDSLREKANGTFLWVSLVMKELEDVQSWEVTEVVKEMPMDLSAVYKRMIGQIRHQRRVNAKFCWEILSTIFTAYYPLSLGELGTLSGLPKEISEHLESMIKLVIMCGSFLTIRQGIVYFIHQSAKDFLSTEAFQSDTAQRHAGICEQSIAVISTLTQNIYGLTDFGFRTKDAPPPNPNPLASLKYSCFCWTEHFCDAYGANPQSETGLALKETTWTFLNNYVLRWLESVILLGGLTDALRSIQKILREVYGSALVFSQTSSDIRQLQWKERLQLIEDTQGVIKTNSALLQTLEGHNNRVRDIRFSLDGQMVASCCDGGKVRVWDAATGAIQHTVTTRCNDLLAVSFSPGNKSVVFVSNGNGITDNLLSLITVSLDDKTPSAQLHDSSIQLNGSAAFGCSQMLEAKKPRSARATFSLDGKMLAIIGRSDDPIELWNAATGLHLRTIREAKKGDELIFSMAFSPDSKTIASGNGDATVNLWNVETGACFATFTTSHPHAAISAIAFRLDDKELALGRITPYGKIRILDMATGKDQETHISLDDTICGMAFSRDDRTIAVGSKDGTIQLWDADLGMRVWTTGDTSSLRTRSAIPKVIENMVFSPDGKTLALSGFLSKEVELWDALKGTRHKTLKIPLRFFTPAIAGDGDGAITFSPDGGTLAFGCRGICLWDVTTGRRIPQPIIEGTYCTAFALSPNGEELASSFYGTEIKLQNMATGKVQREFSKGWNRVHAITFLPEGKTLAAVYDTGLILVWDAATGACLQEFDSGLRRSVHTDPVSRFRYTSIKYLPKGPFFCLNDRYIINLSHENAESRKHDLLLYDGEWITKGGNPLLWLPREYRSKAVAIQDNLVAIGHKSGMTFIRFNSSSPKGL